MNKLRYLILTSLVVTACGPSEEEKQRRLIEQKMISDSLANAVMASIEAVNAAKNSVESKIGTVFLGEDKFRATLEVEYTNNLHVRVAKKNPTTGLLILALTPESEMEGKFFMKTLTGSAIIYTDAGEAIKCKSVWPETKINGASVKIYTITKDGIEKLKQGSITRIMYSIENIGKEENFTSDAIIPISNDVIEYLFF